MIDEYQKYHGVVFSTLMEASEKLITFESLKGYYENSAYAVNNKIGLYIKYSTKRLSPWKFSFQQKHQDTILELKKHYDNLVLALVCGDDGIVGLSFDQLKQVLDENHEPIEWISIKRPKRANYRVAGSDGKLELTITRDNLIKQVLSL